MRSGSGGAPADRPDPAPRMVRAFLAFEIPPGIRERLNAEMRRLRRELPPARWVRPEGVHLTVKFLGESESERLDALVESLTPALEGLHPVTFALNGTGFFPSARRPRVAWIGGTATGAEPVIASVERSAARAGWAAEQRRWSLHLTLARLRSPWSRTATSRFLEWGEHLELDPFRCSELVLFSSVLRPSGAVYSRLAAVPLGGSQTTGGQGDVPE